MLESKAIRVAQPHKTISCSSSRNALRPLHVPNRHTCLFLVPRLRLQRSAAPHRNRNWARARSIFAVRCKVEEEVPPPPWQLTGGDAVSKSSDLAFEKENAKQIELALAELAASLAALPEDILNNLPVDLARDLRDAAYELRTAGTGRDAGAGCDEALERLAYCLYDERNAAGSALRVKEIPVPPYKSIERAALSRRLLGSARYLLMFERLGYPEEEAALDRVAEAMKGAALATSVATVAENAVSAALLPEATVKINLGPLAFEVAASAAATGSATAFGLAYAFQRLTQIYINYGNMDVSKGVSADDLDYLSLADDIQSSFGQLFVVFGVAFSGLSVVIGLALLIITTQVMLKNTEEL
ncbi:hypothetical protein CYMTET_7644 [Cymbomonas tetramitiformis]|uniref:Uncharacterized protein n=1 Tax=Cymbomonas tetramitiformis TaxID=36881 RepID=A0AAE0LHA7_9CHLO|nr:hypothetical protein CYMTET_7644 [Cymbomonas tetramitiformis]